MDLYRDFDYESNSEGSEGENNNYKDKTTQLKHKAQNTFVFESFNTRLEKLKIRINENISNDVSYSKLQSDTLYIEDKDKLKLTIGEQFSNFKSLLEREKSLNNTSDYNQFYNKLNPYTISYVYLFNNYKKVLDVLYESLQSEIDTSKVVINAEEKQSKNWNEKQMKKINSHFVFSILDLLIALIKDIRAESYEYFFNKNFPQVISLLNDNCDSVEIIDHIFTFFVNVFKILESSIVKNFKTVLLVYSEILFNKNKFIRRFAAQSLCFIIKNLSQNDIVDAFDFLFDLAANPNKLFEDINNEDTTEDTLYEDKSKIIIFNLLSSKKALTSITKANSNLSVTKMFIIDSVSEVIMEVLSNKRTLSIKSDIILTKLSSMKKKFTTEAMLIFISSFIKLIKKVKDKDKINTISLFHNFLLTYVSSLDSNYQKIKLDSVIKQLDMFDYSNEAIRTYMLIFSKEILTKNFKESDLIYSEYANGVIEHIIKANITNKISHLEKSLMIDIICLILRFHSSMLTIDIKAVINNKENIIYFMKCLINLLNFSFYQSFSLYAPKYASNVENDEYECFKYNKEKLYQCLDEIINDVDIVDYEDVVVISTTYERIILKEKDEESIDVERLSIVNSNKAKKMIEHINNINIDTILEELTVTNYAKIYSMLMIIDMIVMTNKNEIFKDLIEKVINISVKEINHYTTDINDDIKDELTHVLLNEFYHNSKYYLDKCQGYMSLILKCTSILNNKEKTQHLLSQLQSNNKLSSYGLYYFLSSYNSSDIFSSAKHLVLLSNNTKYKKSYLHQYKNSYLNVYKSQLEESKHFALVSEIFTTMESVYDIVFDFQNDKKYSISIEIIISKIELLLSTGGITKDKIDLCNCLIYFLIGCYWITLTKSVWEILNRTLDRLFTYIVNAAKNSTFDGYNEYFSLNVINRINFLFKYIQSYPSESDFVSKENIDKKNNYVIFSSKSNIKSLSDDNVSYVLSSQNANEFRTISTFFIGVSKGLTSLSTLINSHTSYLNSYINTFIDINKLFNSEIDLYKGTSSLPSSMCIFYNYIIDKENKTHNVLIKLKENLFSLTSKLTLLSSYKQSSSNLLSVIYDQIIISRSTIIQKSAVDIVALFDTRIKSYVNTLYKVIESPVVIIDVSNLSEIKSDNNIKMNDDERKSLIPMMTRLYYSKYFSLSSEGAKMKTKHKINLVNYFIQLEQSEFDDYVNVVLAPIDSTEDNFSNFNIRTYKKVLEILRINLKQITKLFNGRIERIIDIVKRVFIFIKRLCDDIKKDKDSIIKEIENTMKNTAISKTKYVDYYNIEEFNEYLIFFSKTAKEIKKETFKVFDMIFNQFYTMVDLLDRTSKEICNEYQTNLTKKTSKINSIFKFFMSLSRHAKLHFIYRDNTIIISSIMSILSNENAEKQFIVSIIDFINNLLSVYDDHEAPHSNDENVNIEQMEIDDDSENDVHDDTPIDDKTLRMNFEGIIIKNFDMIIEALISLIDHGKIQSTIKDKNTMNVVEILLKMWSLNRSSSIELISKLIKFLFVLLLNDKALMKTKSELNSILKLLHILIIIVLKCNEKNLLHKVNINIDTMYSQLLSLIYTVNNFNSRLILCIVLHEFTEYYKSPSMTAVIDMLIRLNTNRTSKRNIESEIDEDLVLKALTDIDDAFIEKNIEHIEGLIYMLIVLSTNEDFSLMSTSLDKAKRIAFIISKKNLHSKFSYIIDRLSSFLKYRFDYSKIVVEFFNSMNSVNKSELSYSDLYDIQQEDENFLTMILNFKYDLRSEALELLATSMRDSSKISMRSIVNVVIPILKQNLNFRNYSENINAMNKKNSFNVKRKSSTLVEIVNKTIDMIPITIDSIRDNERELIDFMMFLYGNIQKISKNKQKENMYYTIDIFKMSTKSITAFLQHLIDIKFNMINYDEKFKSISSSLLSAQSAEDESFNIRTTLSSILNQISSQYDYQSLKMQSELYATIVNQIFPTLRSLLYDEAKRESKKHYYIRNYILSPFLSVVKIINPLYTRNDIITLSIELINNLNNLDAGARENARQGIEEYLKSLGEVFSLVLFENMRVSLHSGYQRHVLAYTINFVLTFISSSDIIEKSISTLMPVLFDELFGEISEEKEVDALVNKYKEAKKITAFNSFELISSKISLKCLVEDIVTPLKNYLSLRVSEAPVIQRCNEVLNSITKGLKNNNSLNVDEVIEYSYAMINMGIKANLDNAKAVKKMKNVTMKGNDIYTVNISNTTSIDIANQFMKEKNDIIYSTIFSSLGLDFIIVAMKKIDINSYISSNENKFNDVISSVVICLKMSNNATIMSKAIKIVISLFPSKLPIIKKNLQKITNILFKNLLALNSKDILSSQSVLSALSEILSSFKFVSISDDKIKTLITFLKVNIDNIEIKPYVLSCFLSLLKRKVLHPAIYDMAYYIGEIFLTSNENNTITVCYRIFYEFLSEYPMEDKAKMKMMNFFISNIESNTRRCKINSIRMISFFAEKSLTSLNDVFDFLVMKMFTLFSNCDDSDIKELIEKFFSLLFTHFAEDKFKGYYDNIIKIINSNNGNNAIFIFALNMMIIMSNHLFSFITKSKDELMKSLLKIVTSHNKKFKKEIDDKLDTEGEVVNVEISDEWKILYLSYVIIEKLINNYAIVLSSSMIKQISISTSHPHTFIKSISLRLLSLSSSLTDSDINIDALLLQIKHIVMSTNFDDALVSTSIDVVDKVANHKDNVLAISSLMISMCNESKKWISNKTNGVVIINRVLDVYEKIIDDIRNDITKIAKPIIELCYRISNNSLADDSIKKRSEVVMDKISSMIKQEDVNQIYKTVTKEVNLLRQKRKMEQVENFRKKHQANTTSE